jgi:deoxyribodipyrimidine photo-lyase
VTELVWLRRDLRCHDHPALTRAAASARRLVPVFCFDERLLGGRHASGPRTQFMLESLAELDAWLRSRGSRLVIRRGRPEAEIVTLARQAGAARVHITTDVGSFARRRDERVARGLSAAGIEVRWHPGMFIVDELDAIRTADGAPYSVFAPFYRRWRELPRRQLAPVPAKLPPLPAGV